MSVSFQCPDCGSRMTLVVVPGRFRCVCGAAFFARRSGAHVAFPDGRQSALEPPRAVPRDVDVEVARDPERDQPRPTDRIPRQ
jgi:hypothetical protein